MPTQFHGIQGGAIFFLSGKACPAICLVLKISTFKEGRALRQRRCAYLRRFSHCQSFTFTQKEPQATRPKQTEALQNQ